MKPSAAICRARGWRPGTMIRVADELGEARFRITALGETQVLGVCVATREFGFGWSPGVSPEAIMTINFAVAKRLEGTE